MTTSFSSSSLCWHFEWKEKLGLPVESLNSVWSRWKRQFQQWTRAHTRTHCDTAQKPSIGYLETGVGFLLNISSSSANSWAFIVGCFKKSRPCNINPAEWTYRDTNKVRLLVVTMLFMILLFNNCSLKMPKQACGFKHNHKPWQVNMFGLYFILKLK